MRVLGPALLVSLQLCACAPESPTAGVRVVEVEPWGAAYTSGIRAGDILTGWSRDGHRGPIRSPLDVEHVVLDQSPRGPVSVSVWRDGRATDRTLAHSDWAIEMTPLTNALADHVVWQHLEKAESLHRAGDKEGASRWFAEAKEALSDPTLSDVARSFEIRAHGHQGSRELEVARAMYAEGVERIRKRDPGSPLLAWYLDGLGLTEHFLFDDRAEASLGEALALYEALPNASIERSDTLNHLANFRLRQGAHEDAEELYRAAYASRAEVTPDAPRSGGLLANAGLSLRRQGRLDEAERMMLRALETVSRYEPRGLNAAHASRNLGLLAEDKGDYNSAEGYMERSLAIFEEIRPGQFEVAGMLLNLGNIARYRGRLTVAEQRYRAALELWGTMTHHELDIASARHNLGELLVDQGRLDEARALLEAALTIKQQHSPKSPLVATTLYRLATLHHQSGEIDLAEEYHARALEIRRAVIPDTAETAESLFALARVAEDRDQIELAYERRLEAVEILEGQRDRLVFGSEEQSRFSARFHEEYRALSEFLVDTGRAREAFEFLESSRGRSLRALMSQREIARGDLRELVSERKRAEQSLSRARSRLARVAAKDNDRFATIHNELRELQARLDDIRERMGQEVPAIAAEASLRQFSLTRLRSELDPNARLLSYSVGSERTLVFIVSPDGVEAPAVRVHSIALNRDEITTLADRFRAFIERGRETPEFEPPLLHIAAELYDGLWAPLEEDLEGVEGAVIIAEGPLLGLPFGALVDRGSKRDVGGPPAFLAERIALSFEASAAVIANTVPEVAESLRESQAPLELVAFGDPAGAGVPPLPFAREEVDNIAKLFTGGVAIHRGNDATESSLKSTASRARFLHLAAHAELNERFPLSSAILLAGSATSGSEDGRLLAAEVIEELRLQAELVVLSGCDTGRGRELSGEGVLGLARAFRVAGAQSVLASLWRVSDRSTSELMVRFYEHVRSGVPIDAALSRAQRQMIATERWSHPYHWAGFRLTGTPSNSR